MPKVPVNLSNGYRCLAGDIVSQYGLPEGLHNLDSIDCADEYNPSSAIDILHCCMARLPRLYHSALPPGTEMDGGENIYPRWTSSV